mgnify:CR=1 FL=1
MLFSEQPKRGGFQSKSPLVNLDFLACYDLNFPVTIAFADGSTTSANNMDEYLEAVLVFGENPQLVYPITLTDYETGEDHKLLQMNSLTN